VMRSKASATYLNAIKTMTIADRVKESIDKYNSNDLENALIQICIAIDGTAKKVYPHTKNNSKARFKDFVIANLDIITFFTFNTNVFINCQFGDYTIEQFVYEVLRCGLIHEGELSSRFRFTEPGEPIQISLNQWCLPKTFIFGTLLAVIGASANANERITDYYAVEIFGSPFKLNDLWGRADLIRQAIGPPVSTNCLSSSS
jgi:hypothetical protein